MNFEFSDDAQMLREQAREFLRDKCSTKVVRDVLEGKSPYAKDLWMQAAELGWQGASIPEQYGGVGLGYEAVCVLAEELGRVVAPIPFSSTIYLVAEAILAVGTEADKTLLLPKIADGSLIGAFALHEGFGRPSAGGMKVQAADGRLTGAKWPVLDGGIADVAIVVAREQDGVGLYRVDLNAEGVSRQSLKSLDESRREAQITFNRTAGVRLGSTGDAWPLLERLLERAAILIAFEQVGGAEAALMMARDYALQRYAFGRPIASFQAIKHKLADVYVALELARCNAYYGAWALADGDADIPMAAAAARVSATKAFELASKENIQTHGGVGFTWEFDCHLYYRRAKQLGLMLGAAPYWKGRLVDQVERNIAQVGGSAHGL